jgi:hypothetical protein
MGTLVSLYDGAYGPTILIAPETARDLEALVGLFSELVSGTLAESDLCERLACRLDGLETIVLRRQAQRPRKAVQLERPPTGRARVLWLEEDEGWLQCRERAKTLMEGGSPGHQYLSVEGVDDALIELSYLERPG